MYERKNCERKLNDPIACKEKKHKNNRWLVRTFV